LEEAGRPLRRRHWPRGASLRMSAMLDAAKFDAWMARLGNGLRAIPTVSSSASRA
jgi:hypothetical protein